MNYASIKRVLFCSIILLIAILALMILDNKYRHAQKKNEHPQDSLYKLPVDVESVQEGFRYSVNDNGIKTELSGTRIIRRGRKILGLRSTLVKTNYFADVSGTVLFEKDTLDFSASKAEWDILVNRPILLQKNVTIKLNGRVLPNTKRAKIHLSQKTLEVSSDNKRIIKLK